MRNLRRILDICCAAVILPSVAISAGGGSSGYISDAPIPWHYHDSLDGRHVIELIDRAKERIGLDLTTVQGAQNGAGIPAKLTIPYQSLIYWADGTTWVYGVLENGYYTRMPVAVDYIEGDWVALKDGPSIGTEIVAFGAAELFGVDTGTGH